MAADLSLEEMVKLTDIHTLYEFTHEIKPLMATVHSRPCWIIEPIGCVIESTEGVSQMYERMFPLINAANPPKTINTWFADDGYIGEVASDKPTSDGKAMKSSQFAWCEIDDGLVSGECNYFDLDDARYVAGVLGEDFFKLPGVATSPTEP